MGPESLLEVKGPMARSLGSGVVVAPDGGKAFFHAAKQMGKPVLTGVSHARKIFTPVAKLKKSKVVASVTKMIRL